MKSTDKIHDEGDSLKCANKGKKRKKEKIQSKTALPSASRRTRVGHSSRQVCIPLATICTPACRCSTPPRRQPQHGAGLSPTINLTRTEPRERFIVLHKPTFSTSTFITDGASTLGNEGAKRTRKTWSAICLSTMASGEE